jgi:hypothetical protein
VSREFSSKIKQIPEQLSVYERTANKTAELHDFLFVKHVGERKKERKK